MFVAHLKWLECVRCGSFGRLVCGAIKAQRIQIAALVARGSVAQVVRRGGGGDDGRLLAVVEVGAKVAARQERQLRMSVRRMMRRQWWL